MRPRLCDNVGSSHATFNEKRAKRVRLGDFIPGLDRFEQLRVLLTDGFPEFVIRRLEHLGVAPDRDRKETGWADKARHNPRTAPCKSGTKKMPKTHITASKD
jgi:hypothetical protein